ncbi:hypothetical protein NITMOv2_4391 [Nitrospira moscoviensis]|uniref:Uncharacterized protein n=1 Tax=Nitrospira moscoviensis TaxID=42253 RepID=A0A0K2GIJ8_NITMO|nr:hypothetical protein NITMOv2_4391 [Nitrospira moscoviensis]
MCPSPGFAASATGALLADSCDRAGTIREERCASITRTHRVLLEFLSHAVHFTDPTTEEALEENHGYLDDAQTNLRHSRLAVFVLDDYGGSPDGGSGSGRCRSQN